MHTLVRTMLLLACISPVSARTPLLPSPDEVFSIAIHPHPAQLPAHFSATSLMRALPRLKPVYMQVPIGGKIWWQYGVIVLKSKEVLFWRTFRDDFLAVETAGGTVYYALVDD